MSRKSFVITVGILMMAAISFAAFAQNNQFNRGFGQQAQAQRMGMVHPDIDIANKVSLEGLVESINLERGMGYPSFTIVQSGGKKATIVASPFRALLDANYSIAVGDRMSVLAYPYLQVQDTFLAAELKNLNNGSVLVLRDANGYPVGGRGGMERCRGCQCAGPAGY